MINNIKESLYLIGAVLPMMIITWYCSGLLADAWEKNRVLQEQIWECQDGLWT